LTSEGKRKKYLMSTFGEIKYERRLYKDKDNKWRYLLDERLNLGKNQRVSVMFLQRALEEAGEVSYRQARRNLSPVWGEDTYSHETIRGYVKKVGEEIKEKEVLEDNVDAGDDEEEKDKVVYLEADSTGIPIRDKEKGRTEIKLGIFYRGFKERYKEHKEGNNKYFSAVDKYYLGGIESAEEFWEKANTVGSSLFNISEAKHFIIGGDGASWIKEGAKGYKNSIYHLCLYHLHKRIKEAFGVRKEKEKRLLKIVLGGEVVRQTSS